MKNLGGAILLSTVLALPALAQTGPIAAPQPSTIDGALRFVVRSAKNQTRYQIDVLRVDSTVAAAPEGFKLPVIYVLDGNSLFPLVAQMVNVNTSFSSKLPGVLVVSIGYPADPALSRADLIKENLSRRTRDLSPATLARPAPPGSGGAVDFLGFINDELKPFVAARYPVDVQDQTLIGHSFSGLFTVYAFLNAPNAFTRYIAASPSLFWDDHALIKQAATLSAAAPTRLFVAVGGLETKERMGEDMIGDAMAFVSTVQRQNAPWLTVRSITFPDENHISVIPTAVMRGLREVEALR